MISKVFATYTRLPHVRRPSKGWGMKCPSCGSDNRENARFCLHCGERIDHSCPRCGKAVLPSARFCDDCGTSISGPGDDTLVDLARPRTYTPRFLVDKILSTRSAIEGERKLITVLFADVVNYTSIAEKLDPEEVHTIMDACFKLLMRQVHRFEGTITQFTGDGAMALFGAPVAHENHAQRGCYAALSIQDAVRSFAEKLRNEQQVDFRMRVGINSGLVIVGSIGDDLHMDYTALGDTTNLASRLEAMAPPGSILVSKDTYKLAREFFRFVPIGTITVKGKEKPLEAFELAGSSEVETRIGAAAARGLTRFVGREQELGILLRAFENAGSGTGQVIGLVGEAGVGKSRLLLEFRATLAGSDHAFLEGWCLHFGSAMPYLPILDILRSFFDIKEGAGEYSIKTEVAERVARLDNSLGHVVPPIQELFSLTVEDDLYLKLPLKQKREKTFEAVRDILMRESQEQPLVLAIEDLQWIDKTSEEVLTYLIGFVSSARILLILLYRPEHSHPWANRSYFSRIGLDHLPQTARNEMVESLLESREVSSDIVDLVTRRAGGNPLFMEELTFTLMENGYIEKSDSGYGLSKKVSEIQVPDTIQGIISARMDRLDERLKRTMQIASVIGRNFAYSILSKLFGSEEDLKNCLLELQGLEFIYEKSLFPELEYVFKHALVQEVAYNSLLLRRRKEIHAQIAGAIESLYQDRAEEFYEMLAYHYSKSEHAEQAYRYFKLSGIKATKNSALWEAFRAYHEAWELLAKGKTTGDKKTEQLELTMLMISPMISLGFPEDSLHILQEAEKMARDLDATKQLTTICSMIGLYYSVKGDLMLGVRYTEDCFQIALKTNDIDLMAPIAFDLCSNYSARGEFLKIVAVAPKVLAMLEDGHKEFECFDRGYNVYSALSAFHAFSTGYLGNHEAAKHLFEKGLEAAHTIENLYSLGLLEVLSGYLHCNQGDGPAAQEHFQNSIRHLEKGQIFVLLGLAWAGVGWAHYFTDDIQTGLPFVEKGLKIHLDAGINYDLSVIYWFLANMYCELGDIKNARTCVDEAHRLADKNNEIYYIGLTLVSRGRILARCGKKEFRAAEASILQGMSIIDRLGVRPQAAVASLALAEVFLYQGRIEKALDAVKPARATFQEMGMAFWQRRSDMLLHALQAHVPSEA